MLVVVQSCRYVISNFIRSFLRHTNSEVPTVLIDLWNIIETNYLVLSMTHGNITGPPSVCIRRGLQRCRRRRVNVIIGRPGGMVQGNGILKVNGSLSQLRSPLRPSPRQAGLPFLSFLSRVSLSPDPSSRSSCPSLSFSFVFTLEESPSLVAFPFVDQYFINSIFWI